MTGWLQALPEPVDLRLVEPQIALPQWRDFLPIALLCGISILCSLLWLLMEWEYAATKGKETSDTAHHTAREHGRP